MNSVSVTGKNWILKKFDQEKILYLKNNFSLDEITAKLLVLRGIKKEEIKSFLNPSFCYKNSDYFEGLERINSTKLLFHIENLDMLFKQMITIDMQVDREALSYYIIDDNELYADRIANICRQLTLN